uniref:Fungal-type protein kinase domain-containing protein n=1 Tax=Moniliophthora roreri TaxID=221103 RepID=A0A0W0G398_MONRR
MTKKQAVPARPLASPDTVPLHTVSVTDDVTGVITFYIVAEPFTTHCRFPIGRGTRCFWAYDCQRHKIVLLKDTWRVEGYEKEGDIYRLLHEKGVHNIARFLTAGDVPDDFQRCGRTFEHSALDKIKCRIHYHYRLVLDTLGKPLAQFACTWEITNAVYCGVIAHQDPVVKAGVLHRDVSVGNILIVRENGTLDGILIDWELSERIDRRPTEARSYERIGTWPSISIRILTVLGWIAARYVPKVHTRSAFLRAFDSRIGGTGGDDKQRYLMSGTQTIVDIKLHQTASHNILRKLWVAFGFRYGSELCYQMVETESVEKVAAELRKLESHEWTVGVLEDALKIEEWKSVTNDGAMKHSIVEMEQSLTGAQKRKSDGRVLCKAKESTY